MTAILGEKSMIQQNELPDPDKYPDGDVVIFDGQCNFCKSQIRTLQRFNCCGNRLTYISLHDPRVSEKYPDLTHEMMMEQMYVVDRAGIRHGGSDAVRYLTRRLPTLWLAAPLLHLPGTARLWRWLYQQVAKRRYKLAGKSCDDDACSVHFD
jgi:predicted DCC family thiol-disulfide oxidoreductase YuxK